MNDQAGRDNSTWTFKELATLHGSVVFDEHVLVDMVEFQDLIQKVEQCDGQVEIRVTQSPVNGPTEDANGAWYLPLNKPFCCTIRADGKWRVEFSNDREIITIVLSAEIL